MPWVGFEPTIPASERAKKVHDLDRAASMTGVFYSYPHITTWKSIFLSNTITNFIKIRYLIFLLNCHIIIKIKTCSVCWYFIVQYLKQNVIWVLSFSWAGASWSLNPALPSRLCWSTLLKRRNLNYRESFRFIFSFLDVEALHPLRCVRHL
jgi:hypothetical protein